MQYTHGLWKIRDNQSVDHYYVKNNSVWTRNYERSIDFKLQSAEQTFLDIDKVSDN